MLRPLPDGKPAHRVVSPHGIRVTGRPRHQPGQRAGAATHPIRGPAHPRRGPGLARAGLLRRGPAAPLRGDRDAHRGSRHARNERAVMTAPLIRRAPPWWPRPDAAPRSRRGGASTRRRCCYQDRPHARLAIDRALCAVRRVRQPGRQAPAGPKTARSPISTCRTGSRTTYWQSTRRSFDGADLKPSWTRDPPARSRSLGDHRLRLRHTHWARSWRPANFEVVNPAPNS